MKNSYNTLKIKSIKKIGKRKVIDVSVTNNHNFFLANGVLSHNSYGKIGAGKSVSNLSILQSFHDLYKYKIFDLDGGPRNEQLYWAIPSQDTDYWNRLRMIGTFDEEGPKQYKVNFLYPCFMSKLPKKLPKKIINNQAIVNSVVFTIPLKSITTNDISTVIGSISESNKYAWNEILHNSNKNDNAGSLLWLSKKIKGIHNSPLYKNFILPMSREKLIMNSYCDYNLDLIKEAKDIETISVLCLDFVPKDFHMFILNWVCRNLSELLDANKIPKRNIGFIREAGRYFRATADSVLEDKYKIFRNNMTDYIRMGRRGFYLCLDCQSASETKGLVLGGEDFLLMFRLTSWRDKEEVCTELKREKRMRPDQIGDLAFLEKGQAYIAETGRVVKKVQIRLPRTMYWKKEYGNFYKSVWEKFGGEFKNIEEVLDNINSMCKDRAKKLSEKEVQKKKHDVIDEDIKKKTIDNEEIRNIAVSEPTEIEPQNLVVEERKKIKRSVFN